MPVAGAKESIADMGDVGLELGKHREVDCM